MPDATLMGLLVKLGVNSDELQRGLDDAEKKSGASGKKIASSLAKVGGAVVLGGFAAVTTATVAMVGGLLDIAKAAGEAEAVQGKLNAVIEATGGVAGVTAKMANDLANEYSQITMFEDEAIVSGEAMLLTFKNIGADVFPMATEAMLNMSQMMGTDLQGSAIQLGKALNDPVKGISALSRVGVTFTEDQKAMIEAMVAVGDIAGAQGVILAELEGEFGGVAEAAGNTLPGKLTILQNMWGNLKETMGAPLVGGIISQLSELQQPLADLTALFGDTSLTLEQKISGVGNILGSLVGTLAQKIPAIIDMGIKLLQGIIIGIMQALPQLIPALVKIGLSLVTYFTTLIPQMISLGLNLLISLMTGIAQALPTLIPMVVGMLLKIVGIFIGNIPLLVKAGVALLNGLAQGIMDAVPLLVAQIPVLVQVLSNVLIENLPLIITAGINLLMALVDGILAAIPVLIQAIPVLIETILTLIVENLPLILEGAFAIVTALFEGIVNNLPLIIDAIISVVTTILDTIVNNLPMMIEGALAMVTQLMETIIDNLPLIIDAVVTLVLTILQAVINNLPMIVTAAVKIITQLVKTIGENLPMIIQAAFSIITKLIEGIVQMLPDIASAAGDIIQTVITAITDLLPDIAAIGSSIIDGIWAGMQAAWQGFLNSVSNLTAGLPAWVKKLLGITSPSKVFAGIGVNIIKGLGTGFEDAYPKVKKEIGVMIEDLSGRAKIGANITGNATSENVNNAYTLNLFTNAPGGALGEFNMMRAKAG